MPGGAHVEILSSLRRQWILTSALVVLTVIGTAYALVKLPWTYEAKSSVVFLIPTQETKSFGGNPYLGFSQSLNETADVVRYEVMDVATANQLAAQGYTSTYLVADAVDTSGPVLDVTVTGKDKDGTVHTLSGVTSEISTKLSQLQVEIPSAKRIRDLVINYTPQASRVASKKARPLIVVVFVGLIMTVGIPVVVDAVRQRRSSKRKTQRREGSDELNRRLGAARRPADRDYAGIPTAADPGPEHDGYGAHHPHAAREPGRTVRQP
jgi:capsular polysaccharide biosynthesis protein